MEQVMYKDTFKTFCDIPLSKNCYLNCKYFPSQKLLKEIYWYNEYVCRSAKLVQAPLPAECFLFTNRNSRKFKLICDGFMDWCTLLYLSVFMEKIHSFIIISPLISLQ